MRITGIVTGLLLLAGVALGRDDFGPTLRRHNPAQVVLDRAEVLSPADEAAITATATKLFDAHDSLLVVVTVDALADYGGQGMAIETFARLLFDRWHLGAGSPGVLLVFSRRDRRARIELGATWTYEQNALCRRIMDEHMVPRFKEKAYAKGLRAGVAAIGNMVAGDPLPRAPIPRGRLVVWIVFGALLAAGVASVLVGGRNGWVARLANGFGSFLGSTIKGAGPRRGRRTYYPHHHDSFGGGWGGGSGGGGGGGGATGSW